MLKNVKIFLCKLFHRTVGNTNTVSTNEHEENLFYGSCMIFCPYVSLPAFPFLYTRRFLPVLHLDDYNNMNLTDTGKFLSHQ
jgi:hypothetical protein